METVDLPNGPLQYRAFGPADSTHPPVVFLHPVLTDGRVWDGVAERLAAAGVRSYSPNLPLGSHTVPLPEHADRTPVGIAQMARDFLAALDLTNVTLVGNDTGGALTQFILDSGDPRVSRAVLANCDAFTTFPPFPFNLILRALALPGAARPMAEQMRLRAIRHSWLGFGLLSTNLPPQLTRSWIEAPRTDRSVCHDVVEFIKNVHPADLDPVTKRMAQVDKPVTVIWGMADRVFKPALGRRLADTLAHARFVPIEGARTLLAFDAPDQLSDEIIAIAAR